MSRVRFTRSITGQPGPTPGPLAAIARIVGAAYDVTVEELRGPCREATFIHPRHATFQLAHELTPMSLPQIGRWFHRDHTTVLHGIRRSKANGYVTDAMRAAVADALAENNAPPVFRSTRWPTFRSTRTNNNHTDDRSN